MSGRAAGWIRRWAGEVGDAHVLGTVRVAFGAMLFWQTLELGRDLETRGYFGDAFHVPFVPEAWVPSARVYAGLLAARLFLAALVLLGQAARPALFASAALGLYGLLCDRVEFHHNRYALFCFALLLAFTPCHRAIVLTRGDVEGPGARLGSLWAPRVAQLQVSLIYVASGGSKLLDHEWRDGLVIADRFARYGGEALARGVPAGVVEWFSRPAVTSNLAKLAIATELLLAVGLWLPRTRVIAIWWGVMFHLTIEVTSRVELFTWLTLTTYAFFVVPDHRARKLYFDATRPSGAWTARVVAALDWFARFDARPWSPDGLRGGHSVVVVRRDGTRATGVRALAMIARCVPLLFPLWAPLALAASFTRGGEANTRA